MYVVKGYFLGLFHLKVSWGRNMIFSKGYIHQINNSNGLLPKQVSISPHQPNKKNSMFLLENFQMEKPFRYFSENLNRFTPVLKDTKKWLFEYNIFKKYIVFVNL